MGSDSSVDPGSSRTAPRGPSIELALPVRDTNLFKHTASSPILNFLSDNPDMHLSVRQLATVTPTSKRAALEAVNTLEANGLVETFREGNARRVRINRDRLTKPDDPILSIPQSEFQTPVRVACQYLEDELENVEGIILFGSTARGEADRRSDIDLWVLVASDHMENRHAANKLVNQLEDLKIPSSIGADNPMSRDAASKWEAIKTALENESQNSRATERYSFEILVETPQSILNQSDRVDGEKLFGEGITLYSTETLERTKLEVLTDE